MQRPAAIECAIQGDAEQVVPGAALHADGAAVPAMLQQSAGKTERGQAAVSVTVWSRVCRLPGELLAIGRRHRPQQTTLLAVHCRPGVMGDHHIGPAGFRPLLAQP